MRTEEITAIESESGVIASLIRHPEFSFYSEQLLPNYFYDIGNRYIYAAICNLAQQGIKNVDPYNIMESLNSKEGTKGYPKNTITVESLQELCEYAEIMARNSVEEYKLVVDNVMEAAFRRDTLSRLRECERLCYDKKESNIEQKIYSALDDVMMEFSTTNDVPPYRDVVDGCWEEIKSRQGAGYSGIPFKFPSLNEYATIEKGELFIFGAEQKQGKSIMLLNCAVDLLKKDYAVLYVDSELNTRLFTARLLSHLSGVSYRRLTAGGYNEEEERAIIEAKEWLKTRKFTHIYIPMFDQQSIYTNVKKVMHTQGLDVLIIDYFKSSNGGDAFNSYQELGKAVDK